MKKKKKQILILIILIILLFTINYSFLDLFLIDFFDESETGIVERIIDGDTVVVDGGNVRLLGINSPEKGEYLYDEAKKFLEDLILNKEVKLKFGKEKKDMYNRTLSYLFLKGKNVNLEMVKEGLANFYFPSGKDEYYDDFVRAWEKCAGENKNLCEKSKDKCADCIELENLDVKNQEVVFYNKCYFDCDLNNWEIKDEGRKNFIFSKTILKPKKEIKITAKDFEEDYVWTSSGDSLFLRDGKRKLVLWRAY